jgi:hypothetical protein
VKKEKPREKSSCTVEEKGREGGAASRKEARRTKGAVESGWKDWSVVEAAARRPLDSCKGGSL